MDAVRTLATLGRAAREEEAIKVRQPLGVLYAVVPDGYRVTGELLEIARDELNVKSVDFMDQAEALVTFSARPNFKALGARLGKLTPRVANLIRELSSEQLAAFRAGEALAVELDGQQVPLRPEDLDIVQTARGDLRVQAEGGFTVALDPAITPELRAEGLARELVNRVQRLRKDAGLQVSDRIRLGVAGADEIRDLDRFRDFVAGETLARELTIYHDGLPENGYSETREVDLDGVPAAIGLAVAEA
jgi:isoleucyl-tRNA synthetase